MLLTTNTQNSFAKDVCINEDVMFFEDVDIESLIFGAYKVYDSSHNLIKSAGATATKLEEH